MEKPNSFELTPMLWAMPRNAQAQVYVAQINMPSASGFVSEYSTTGELINANFITGLLGPTGLVVSGNTLFVANADSNTVGKYDATTGGVINASFITALEPVALAVSFNSLFVTHNISQSGYAVGVYDATTGAAINPSFFEGRRLILAGRRNTTFGLEGLHLQKVGKYNATTGAAINMDFITGLTDPTALAVLGNKLFVASLNPRSGLYWVSEYNATTGAELNVPLIETDHYTSAIAVQGIE